MNIMRSMEYSSFESRPLLGEVSNQLGIELSAQKRIELERLRATARKQAIGSLYYFTQNGLKIELWHKFGGATVDFTPGGYLYRPDDQQLRDRFALDFLQSTQNYLLLVEAAFLEKPGWFSATTNQQMATFLEQHYGYEVTPENGTSCKVIGNYEAVKQRAFSDAAKAAEVRLTARIAS